MNWKDKSPASSWRTLSEITFSKISSGLWTTMRVRMMMSSHVIWHRVEEVIEKCILVVAKNFSSLFSTHGPSFINFLPYAYALQLLNHTSLAVHNESMVRHLWDIALMTWQVFETVVTYLNHSKEFLSSSYDSNATEEVKKTERHSFYNDHVTFPSGATDEEFTWISRSLFST